MTCKQQHGSNKAISSKLSYTAAAEIAPGAVALEEQ